jgi:hypothetical protein
VVSQLFLTVTSAYSGMAATRLYAVFIVADFPLSRVPLLGFHLIQ